MAKEYNRQEFQCIFLIDVLPACVCIEIVELSSSLTVFSCPFPSYHIYKHVTKDFERQNPDIPNSWFLPPNLIRHFIGTILPMQSQEASPDWTGIRIRGSRFTAKADAITLWEHLLTATTTVSTVAVCAFHVLSTVAVRQGPRPMHGMLLSLLTSSFIVSFVAFYKWTVWWFVWEPSLMGSWIWMLGPQLKVLFGEFIESLAGEALLEEAHLWGGLKGFIASSPSSSHLHAVAGDAISQLSALAVDCYPSLPG